MEIDCALILLGMGTTVLARVSSDVLAPQSMLQHYGLAGPNPYLRRRVAHFKLSSRVGGLLTFFGGSILPLESQSLTSSSEDTGQPSKPLFGVQRPQKPRGEPAFSEHISGTP